MGRPARSIAQPVNVNVAPKSPLKNNLTCAQKCGFFPPRNFDQDLGGNGYRKRSSRTVQEHGAVTIGNALPLALRAVLFDLSGERSPAPLVLVGRKMQAKEAPRICQRIRSGINTHLSR